MSRHYTTDPYGNIAVPNLRAGFVAGYVDKLPVILGGRVVRRIAREIADSIIEDARTEPGPVVWITGNAYVPPLRSIPQAEYVWQAENNEDGELFAWLTEMVEDHLSAASVLLECPDYDNALYAVDLRRWQYRDTDEPVEDLNEEWEPVDPNATDDNAENPRE